jgi:hypothetical protein
MGFDWNAKLRDESRRADRVVGLGAAPVQPVLHVDPLPLELQGPLRMTGEDRPSYDVLPKRRHTHTHTHTHNTPVVPQSPDGPGQFGGGPTPPGQTYTYVRMHVRTQPRLTPPK